MNIEFDLCSNSPVSIKIQDIGGKKPKSQITILYEEKETITFDFVSMKKRPVDSTRFDLSKKGHVTMTLTGGRTPIVIDPKEGVVISGGRYVDVLQKA